MASEQSSGRAGWQKAVAPPRPESRPNYLVDFVGGRLLRLVYWHRHRRWEIHQKPKEQHMIKFILGAVIAAVVWFLHFTGALSSIGWMIDDWAGRHGF